MKSWTPSLTAIAVALTLQIPVAAAAQEVPVPDEETEGVISPSQEIVVTGRSLRGQIDAPEAPIIELDSEDIAAYGASSIADLVAQLAPQTGSSRGRGGGGQPVFLVNGLRVSSFREFRSYPPEAIEKVEVLPEEVAQRYGFPPNRRVINFVMKDNYSSREIELEFEAPDRGGYSARETELTYLKLGDQSRFNLNFELSDASLLTEAERDIVQTPASLADAPDGADLAAFRSLRGESRNLELTGNYTTRLGEGATSLSANGTYERSEGRSLSGIREVNAGVVDPLDRRSRSDTLSFGSALNTVLGDNWDTALTLDLTRVEGESEIDRRVTGDVAEREFDIARSRTNSVSSKATFRGAPLVLPAGEVSTTFDLGVNFVSIDSEDTRTVDQARLTRTSLTGGTTVTVPIAERDYAWGAIGNLSLNLRAGFEDISDFGMLGDYSVGLTWGPTDALTLTGSYISGEAAPSLSQLGSPTVETLNVPVFDFATGETNLATIISGGNPDLLAESQSDWKFAVNWQPWFWEDARLNVEYFDNSSRDITSSFPFLTPEIEAAFPDRVTRNAFGELETLDRRPITFARQDSSRLAVGLTLRGSFGKANEPEGPPAGAGGAEGGGPQNGGGESGGEGARAGGRPGGGPGGRPGGDGGRPEMTEEQREQFMAFRTRFCADDGMEYIRQFVAAVDGDEAAIAAMGPDFDPAQGERLLSRARNPDGTVDFDRIAQFRGFICSQEAGASGGQATGGQGGGRRGGGRRGGGGGAFGGDDGRGRYFLNLTYNRELSNEILVAEGGPVLDLLAGDALSEGGTTRDGASLEAGAFRGGLGMRLSGRYSGSSEILGTGAPGSTDLFFGDLMTFDLRLFANLGEVIGERGIWKGTRVSLRADNIFDTRREVVDQDGNVPLAYQPFLIDPVGRYLGIDFRKLF